MTGKFIGVGVGPGDAELITLKAVRVLNETGVIAVPRTKGEKNAAFDIAAANVDFGGKEIIYIDFPMTKDKKITEENRKQIALKIEEYLKAGKDVAFITLGDVAVYSTYGYIADIVKNDGYETQMISGVPSFCAIAARLGISLTDMKKPLHIIPALYDDTEKRLELDGSLVLMKAGSSMGKIKTALRDTNFYSAAAENCGMENEKIFTDIENAEDKEGYFTTVIIKK